MKEKGFSNYVPIYHATDGNYILSDGTYNYYLMPWLERAEGNGEDNDQYHKMFRTLGTLHQKTVKEEMYTEEDLENIIQIYPIVGKMMEMMLEEFLCRIGSRSGICLRLNCSIVRTIIM